MFFEDEKDNLSNLDNFDDLDIDLDEDIDDESINWDELLKDDSADSLVSVAPQADKVFPSAEPKKRVVQDTEPLVSVAPVTKQSQAPKVEAPAPKAQKYSGLSNADYDLSNVEPIETKQRVAPPVKHAPVEEVSSQKDAFEVFGGEKPTPKADNAIDELDEMENVADMEDDNSSAFSEDDNKKSGIGSVAVIIGVLFALVLVAGSIAYMYIGPKLKAPLAQGVSQTNDLLQDANLNIGDNVLDENAGEEKSGKVKLPNQKNDKIPVINEKNAKKLKADKKIVLSVESVGRENPFLPTTVTFNEDLYLGIPTQTLAPPEAYGNDKDAQDVMKVSVSGILYDGANPSAIITINGTDYFVQKNDMIDDYKVLEITRLYVIIKKGKNIYKAGVGEIFNQNLNIDGSAVYQSGARKYTAVKKQTNTNKGSMMNDMYGGSYSSADQVDINIMK